MFYNNALFSIHTVPKYFLDPGSVNLRFPPLVLEYPCPAHYSVFRALTHQRQLIYCRFNQLIRHVWSRENAKMYRTGVILHQGWEPVLQTIQQWFNLKFQLSPPPRLSPGTETPGVLMERLWQAWKGDLQFMTLFLTCPWCLFPLWETLVPERHHGKTSDRVASVNSTDIWRSQSDSIGIWWIYLRRIITMDGVSLKRNP